MYLVKPFNTGVLLPVLKFFELQELFNRLRNWSISTDSYGFQMTTKTGLYFVQCKELEKWSRRCKKIFFPNTGKQYLNKKREIKSAKTLWAEYI